MNERNRKLAHCLADRRLPGHGDAPSSSLGVLMRVVSENTDTDLARKRAEKRVKRALQELAANLLRVARGAGRPPDVFVQAGSLVDAAIAYREAVGTMPPADLIAGYLDVDQLGQVVGQGHPVHEVSLARGWETIMRGSLQVTASRLVGQPMQEQAGKSEMLQGVESIEAIWSEMRAERRAAERSAKPVRTPKAKPRKGAPRPTKRPLR